MINRRSLLASGAAFGAASTLGFPRGAMAAETVLITQAVTALAFIQNYVAKSQGFFDDEGVKAQLIDTRGGGPDVQMVLAGRADFTTNDGAQIIPAIQEGKSMVCVLSLLNRSIINVTMSSKAAEKTGVTEDSPFEQKVAALKGLRIGVTRPGALTWQIARSNLINAGMNPDSDAEIIGIGSASALAAALENDNVDVMYISVPIGDRIVSRGNGITLIDNARGEDPNIPNFIMEGLWVTPEYLEEKPELVGATVKALKRASAFIIESEPEKVADAVSGLFGSIDREVLVAACTRVAKAVSADGKISESDLHYTTQVLRTNGFLKREFTVADIFDSRFV